MDLSDLCMLCGEQICFTYYTLLNTVVYTHNQVAISSKNIKLKVNNKSAGATMMQQYLRWSCGFNYGIVMHCYADFEVVCIFELMTQPSENCSGAENC